MKKLVIIGANDFQDQLIQKANLLGYETHVFAWEEGATGKEHADFFYPISITEKEKILDICKTIEPCGVCSIASDLASITVNFVAEGLGLPCNSMKYSKMQTNKYEMRKALLAAGVSCPKFVLADEEFDISEIADFRFPIIVKPTDRSGSRNIMKLESLDGLEKAIREACATSFEHKAIVEEYISGSEYSMETISRGGKHTYLATTKKFTTDAPHFIETGHLQPSGLAEDILERAVKTVMSALDALHIENSAGHSEFKVDDDGNINIIEIGARMGGDCIGSDLVYLSTGLDFVKMVIDVACGNELDLEPAPNGGWAEVRFLFSKEDVEAYEAFAEKNKAGIYRTSAFDMSNAGNVSDSSTRIGYYIIVR